MSRKPRHQLLQATTEATPCTAQCAICWGHRMVWEPSALGLLPVVCADCDGTGLAVRSGAVRQTLADSTD